MNQRSLNLSAGTTTVHEWGSAKDDPIPFVMLHSLGLDGSSFRWLAAAMSRRKPSWILAPDLRGHGAFACDEHSVSLTGMAQDVVEMLDAMGITKARLLGASMGSFVARMAASTDPARWTSVALVAGGPSAFPSLADRGAPALAGGMQAVEAETLKRWFSEADIKSDHECVRYAREKLLAMRPADWAASWRAMASFPAIPPLNEELPSICIGGDLDASATPALMHDMKRVARVRIGPIFIPDAHHMLPLSKAEALSEILAARETSPSTSSPDQG
ncbi:alpha/beta fold hydrolase [Variovorax sp. MHTC-1]|uniref:alpha/beta fold hydrolase n=1 Tax=Variovorax sp. MHTC-1 TaxID=2495593 RepID=UPI000F861CB7|nr:alpha/beta hydrolase [Variovorax sp. MHTC-1]RST48479.1 alpha/beta fold hydrolase [Variovorax sp. MHTC-1]